MELRSSAQPVVSSRQANPFANLNMGWASGGTSVAPRPDMGNITNYGDYVSYLQGEKNPYDTNSEAFKKALFGKQQAVSRTFDPQQHALAGSLAGRGLMGSGQEAASRAALGGAQAAQLADIETGAYDQANQQAAQWKANQIALLGSALGQKAGLDLSEKQLAQSGDQFNRQFKEARRQGDLAQRQFEHNQFWAPVNALTGAGGKALGGWLGGM